MLAYMIQVNYWLKKYNIEIEYDPCSCTRQSASYVISIVIYKTMYQRTFLADGASMLLFIGCENFCRTSSRKYWSALDKNPPFKEAILRSQLGL